MFVSNNNITNKSLKRHTSICSLIDEQYAMITKLLNPSDTSNGETKHENKSELSLCEILRRRRFLGDVHHHIYVCKDSLIIVINTIDVKTSNSNSRTHKRKRNSIESYSNTTNSSSQFSFPIGSDMSMSVSPITSSIQESRYRTSCSENLKVSSLLKCELIDVFFDLEDIPRNILSDTRPTSNCEVSDSDGDMFDSNTVTKLWELVQLNISSQGTHTEIQTYRHISIYSMQYYNILINNFIVL
jgi:hypothetical protein